MYDPDDKQEEMEKNERHENHSGIMPNQPYLRMIYYNLT